MPRYAAFLRGINVGGHRVTSADLCACFVEMGFAGAAAFRASGNVVLDTDAEVPEKDLAVRIEDGLEEALGYSVPVFLRDARAVRGIAELTPFPAAAIEASKGKVQVLLLAAKPPAKVRKQVLAYASAEDQLVVEGRELYWLPSGGISQSELDLSAIGALLGVGTMRTKGTIELIAAKYFSD